jgi:hypothetical protein
MVCISQYMITVDTEVGNLNCIFFTLIICLIGYVWMEPVSEHTFQWGLKNRKKWIWNVCIVHMYRGEYLNWRELRKEELHNLCSSANIIMVIKSNRTRWAVHVACMGNENEAHRILVGEQERKIPLGIPRRRLGVILKWILDRMSWCGPDWSGLE